MLLRRVVRAALLFGTLGVPLGVAFGEETVDYDFFERKIRPVLVEHCYECHAADSDELQGGLRLDNRESLRAGGPSGPGVVPGEPAESLLLDAIRYESFEMPPKGKLPDAVIRDFEKWIASGAADPRDGSAATVNPGIDIDAGRQFWSFRPFDAQVPHVVDTTWADSEIDRFIRAEQEEVGVSPGPSTDRATLARRLFYDIVGVPPTQSQLDEFLQDSSPDAYSRLVDRLLASADFGPQWGRRWLDVVRYADSSGGGRTRIFREAWRYRDYVIDAFNEDRPFDQFVIEQLAGDLIPYESDAARKQHLTATGFLALGPTNYELQDKEMLRMEVVDEQLDTMGRALLGMTIGCARCHDHKFDPIGVDDYYALAGILRSTKTLIHANVSDPIMRELPVSQEHRERLDAHASELAQLKKTVAELEKSLKQFDPQSGKSVAAGALPGIVIDDTQANFAGQWQKSNATPRFVGEGYRHDRNQQKGLAKATFTTTVPDAGIYELRIAYAAGTNRSANVPVNVRTPRVAETVFVDQTQSPAIDGLLTLIGKYELEAGSEVSVIIENSETQGHVIIDAIQWLDSTKEAPKAKDAPFAARVAELQDELKHRKRELKELEGRAPQPADRVMSVEDEEKPEDAYVCIRGNVHNRGNDVPRGFLRVADHAESWNLNANESGRRELAEWICSDHNPLTARVMANRVWHHLFGVGLVGTPDNFGFTGERPTHPRLLDYLALQLIEHEWSIKALIREIVHSRTYRLSSQPIDSAATIDPNNVTFWRQHRRRLTAEQLRDAILVCSGQLDRQMGGASVKSSADSEFGYHFEGVRRGVYVPVFRNAMMDMFEVFDVADPNIVVGKRNVSTRATQALYMMNSPFVVEQATHLADRALRAAETNDDRVGWLYRHVLGRAATESEASLTRTLVRDLQRGGTDELDAWAMATQALFACLDFRYVH